MSRLRRPSLAPRALVLGVLLLGPVPAAAQMPWDTGPHQVGLRAHVYPTPLSSSPFGAVYGRSFYPATADGLDAPPDIAGGPYPHVAFLHGHTIDTSHYVVAMKQLASWGFVVTGCDTNVGFIKPAITSEQAADQLLLMDFVEGEDKPGGFFEGLFDGGDWGVVGHSMGAGAAFFFASQTPRCRVISSHQPYLGDWFGGTLPASTAMDAYTGSMAVVAATADDLTPWDTMVYPWYESAPNASRRLFPLVQGMGHLGLVDVPQTGDPMSADEQDRITYLWMTGYLLAELKGEHQHWDLLFGEAAATEPWTLESGGAQPALWSQTSLAQPGDLSMAVAGDYGALGFVAIALQPASIPTAWGTLGINPASTALLWSGVLDPATGLALSYVPIQPSSSGLQHYVQALQLHPTGAGAFSATIPWLGP